MRFVGIDVSKDWLDMHVVPEGESFRSPNTSEGLDQLAARLCELNPERAPDHRDDRAGRKPGPPGNGAPDAQEHQAAASGPQARLYRGY